MQQIPSLAISHLHMPMVMLPFIIMQQLVMPLASILHRFCIMAIAVGSSHEKFIFMPSVHFSIFIVQRGKREQSLLRLWAGIWKFRPPEIRYHLCLHFAS